MTQNRPTHTVAINAKDVLAMAEVAKQRIREADKANNDADTSIYIDLWPDRESDKVQLRNNKQSTAIFKKTYKEKEEIV